MNDEPTGCSGIPSPSKKMAEQEVAKLMLCLLSVVPDEASKPAFT